MSKQYYFQNMFWGYFIVIGIFYSFWGIEKDYKTIILTISAMSAFFYPFSKFLIEKIAISRTGESFWYKGLFRDGVPKTKMMLFYYVFCLLFAIPFGLACIFIELKSRR